MQMHSFCKARVTSLFKCSLVQWNWFSDVTGCTWLTCICLHWRQSTNFTAPGCIQNADFTGNVQTETSSLLATFLLRVHQFFLFWERKEVIRRREWKRKRERRLRAANLKSLFEILLDSVNQAVPNHLTDESQTRLPDTPPDHPQDYKVPLGSSPTKSRRKRSSEREEMFSYFLGKSKFYCRFSYWKPTGESTVKLGEYAYTGYCADLVVTFDFPMTNTACWKTHTFFSVCYMYRGRVQIRIVHVFFFQRSTKTLVQNSLLSKYSFTFWTFMGAIWTQVRRWNFSSLLFLGVSASCSERLWFSFTFFFQKKKGNHLATFSFGFGLPLSCRDAEKSNFARRKAVDYHCYWKGEKQASVAQRLSLAKTTVGTIG